jgi:SAM-dependent methyltransferase
MGVDPMHGEGAEQADRVIPPPADWDTIADWWRGEASGDPVYREDVAPMLSRLLDRTAAPVLDLGCGDGQWLRWLDRDEGSVIGCDRSGALLADAARSWLMQRLPIPWCCASCLR